MSRPRPIVLACCVLLATSGCLRRGTSAAGGAAAPPAELAPGSAGAPAPGAEDEAEDARLEAGFRLMRDERLGELGLGMTDARIAALLGPPAERGVIRLQAADGRYYQEWRYPTLGLELSMSSESDSGPQTLALILARAPCTLATLRGVVVGSPAEAAIEAYREHAVPDSLAPEGFVAGSAYGGVLFRFDGEQVCEIRIGALAE